MTGTKLGLLRQRKRNEVSRAKDKKPTGKALCKLADQLTAMMATRTKLNVEIEDADARKALLVEMRARGFSVSQNGLLVGRQERDGITFGSALGLTIRQRRKGSAR